MNCREFEALLDRALLGDEQPVTGKTAGAEAGESLERHASDCAECAELLTLSRLPREDAGGLTAEVLRRTASGACRRAEELLNDFVTARFASGSERQLVAGHLEHCRACSGLAGELRRLEEDLPRLSRPRLETSLVPGVLRRTLPAPVRLRRWWRASWPRWVRRPRFAVELAYAATLVLVVIFATPVAPVQAMPERVLGLARSEALPRVEAAPEATWHRLCSKLDTAADRGRRGARRLEAGARASLGTILEEVASWFETADDNASAPDQTKQETQ